MSTFDKHDLSGFIGKHLVIPTIMAGTTKFTLKMAPPWIIAFTAVSSRIVG